MCAVIFCATLLAYSPALRAGFIWDDNPGHVTTPELRSLDGLGRIWFEIGATQQYYPLLHSAFWLEHRLWGDAPFGYHLLNVLLHATAACLAGVALRRLAVPGAWLAALLFALHPVAVESVAWISEQKNTLSTVFYLGAALAYLRFDRQRQTTAYLLATGLFVAALLTKTVTATLPAALLLVFWWQRGRLSWRRDVMPLAPWFLLGACAGLFTAWAERKLIGAEGAAFDLTLLERGLLAGRAITFYLGKLLWPEDLTFIYPRWSVDPTAAWQWFPLALVLVLAAVCWRRRQWTRGPLAAFLFFAGSLFPVLGFFNVYPFIYSFVADHFQYLASLGPIALAAAGAARLGARFPAWSRWTAGALLASTLGALTWQQCRIYHDAETLYRATLRLNPACWMAHNNLGKELMVSKTQLPEAIAFFETALRLRPAYAEAENNLGLALTQSGRPREAIPHLERSLQLRPGVFQVYNNLGIALAAGGRADAAVAVFARAAALNSSLPNLQENWAKALLLLGRKEEAEVHFARAAALRVQAATSP
jgi:protein O-mannosyl-transferase